MTKDTDFRKKGGFFEGEVEGHANSKSRIRRKDGFFKGEEIGYVDSDKKIRKKDGFFKGEQVGQVKGSKAHAKDGFFSGQEFGYVDDQSNVRLKDGFFKGRIIGKVKGKNIEGALGYYVLKFKGIEEKYEKLRDEVRRDGNKGKYLGRVKSMLEFIPKADALGDFDKLISNIKKLEKEIYGHLNNNLSKKENICSRAESLSQSTEWKSTGEKFKQLQAEWKKIGQVPKEKADQVWNRFSNAKQRFFDNRKKHFDKLDQERKANLSKKENICGRAESLSHSTDWKGTGEKFKQLQAEWKKIGQVPKEKADQVWNRFNNSKQRFFDNRKKHFDKLDQERKANLSKKENICSRAESLSHSTDWKGTGEKFKQLQAEWKSIGQVPKEKADQVWNRFNNAKQRFFDNRKKHFDALERERMANLSKKERICSHAESLSYSSEWKETGANFKQLQSDWKSIGPVPKDSADRLWQRFNSAKQTFFDRRSQYFEEKNRERERRQEEWRQRMRETIRKLENSIDFDESKIRDLENKIWNVRPGKREYEIKESMRSRIRQIEDKISSKRSKIRDIESKL